MNILIVSLLSAAGIAGAAETPAAKTDVVDGKKLFASSCASCHGKDGKGNEKMAKMFKVEPSALDLSKKSTQDQKDADLQAVIGAGRKKMPKFGTKLKEAQITGLISQVRTLGAPAAKPETKP